jgi:membrane associated rhomboid family serine protease
MSLPPPPPPAIEACYRHPDRPTGRRCTRCGRPACSECLVQATVGSHCRDCVKAAAPTTTERVRRWNAGQPRIVTSVLIAINAAIFLIDELTGGFAIGGEPSIKRWGFLDGPDVYSGEWWRLITSGFLHENLVHVGMNMFVLYQLGNLLEPALGRVRYLAIYFAALLAGSAGALLLDPNKATLGASGAIFGLLGALAIGMHIRGVNIWSTGIGTLIVLNLVITFAVPGISVGGHIGGIIGGGLAGGAMFAMAREKNGYVIGMAAAVAVGIVSVLIALTAANHSVVG